MSEDECSSDGADAYDPLAEVLEAEDLALVRKQRKGGILLVLYPRKDTGTAVRLTRSISECMLGAPLRTATLEDVKEDLINTSRFILVLVSSNINVYDKKTHEKLRAKEGLLVPVLIDSCMRNQKLWRGWLGELMADFNYFSYVNPITAHVPALFTVVRAQIQPQLSGRKCIKSLNVHRNKDLAIQTHILTQMQMQMQQYHTQQQAERPGPNEIRAMEEMREMNRQMCLQMQKDQMVPQKERDAVICAQSREAENLVQCHNQRIQMLKLAERTMRPQLAGHVS